GRAGERADRAGGGQDFAHDFGRAFVGAGFEAFAQTDGEAQSGGEVEAGGNVFAGGAQGLGGAGEQDDLGLHEHGREFVAELQVEGEGVAGEVVGVFAGGGEREGLFETARHEGDRVSGANEVDGDGGAPGTGSDDG